MGKVYEISRWSDRKLPAGLSQATVETLHKSNRHGYLVESPNYDLEAVLSNFLPTMESETKDNRHKILIVAPPLGPYDFSDGALVSVAEKWSSPDQAGDPFLASIDSQLDQGTWIELRTLWEIAIHEFISPLATEKPEENVDNVLFGNFWLDGKDDFRQRFYDKRLSDGLKLISTTGSPFEPAKLVSPSDLIFGWTHWSVLSYHRVIPEPLAELTRAQMAEMVQTRSFRDVSKRATRDKLIRDEIAQRIPGEFRRQRILSEQRLEKQGWFGAVSRGPNGYLTIH